MFEVISEFLVWLDDPFILDVLGHISYSFIALGMLLLAKKSILGWISRFIGEAGWLLIGFVLEMSSIWSWGLLFLCIEIFGFWSWWKDREIKDMAV
jgi:hypothetical protein